MTDLRRRTLHWIGVSQTTPVVVTRYGKRVAVLLGIDNPLLHLLAIESFAGSTLAASSGPEA